MAGALFNASPNIIHRGAEGTTFIPLDDNYLQE